MSGARSITQRLLAVGGLVVIVGGVLAVLAVAGVLGNQGGGEGIGDVVVLDPPRAAGQEPLDVGPAVGKLAPDFEISDFDGERHRLSDFRGKVVYVNFWATSCDPCKRELPAIQQLADLHPDDLVVIAVNRRESLSAAEGYFERAPNLEGGEGVSFTVNGLDPDDTLYDEFRAIGMPASYFIGPDGVVSSVFGGEIFLEDMEAAVAEAQAGG